MAALVLIALTAVGMFTSNSFIPQVHGQSSVILSLIGYDGTTKNYTLSELQSLPSVSGYGGYYQPNQNQINSGNWTGVSLNYLCNQTSGITPTCTISVIGQGTNNFTYEMVANGTNLNPPYITYNNATGANQNQTQPVTLLLSYFVNGTNLPTSIQPAPRLVIIGPEGLLMIGTGGKSITQVKITNAAPTPTSTPTPTPTPTATPTPSPNPTSTIAPSSAPTSTPTATSPQHLPPNYNANTNGNPHSSAHTHHYSDPNCFAHPKSNTNRNYDFHTITFHHLSSPSLSTLQLL